MVALEGPPVGVHQRLEGGERERGAEVDDAAAGCVPAPTEQSRALTGEGAFERSLLGAHQPPRDGQL